MMFYKDKFRLLRESRGLTLDDVAVACNVSKPTVQRWEKKKNFQPRPAKIPMLAKLLHCAESDLAQYGGPLEKHLDALNAEDEQCRKLLFGADIADERNAIMLALHRRSELSVRDPNYESMLADENGEIRENLRLAFKKISQQLNVPDLPAGSLDDFRFGLLRALIKSAIAPEEKDKALKIVEDFNTNTAEK